MCSGHAGRVFIPVPLETRFLNGMHDARAPLPWKRSSPSLCTHDGVKKSWTVGPDTSHVPPLVKRSFYKKDSKPGPLTRYTDRMPGTGNARIYFIHAYYLH